jgi:hypothetical protein
VRAAFLASLAAGLILCACGGRSGQVVAPPPGPVPADGSIRIQATAVPLDPKHPAETRLGALVYAGGVELTSADTTLLHGLSGIDVAANGVSFISQSDVGNLLTGRLVLDGSGRLVGVANARLQPLRDERGQPLQGKQEGDAEDITWLAHGGFAVSFEEDHRVLGYQRPGGPARLLWRPRVPDELGFKLHGNTSLEALTEGADGRTLYLGSEYGDVRAMRGGRIGAMRLSPQPPRGFSLTGLDRLDGDDWIALYRDYDPFHGARAVIAALPAPHCIRAPCDAPHPLTELARLQRPFTVDNMEGIAAVPLPGGGWRLYLISDDNFSSFERTLLLAFDWRPQTER